MSPENMIDSEQLRAKVVHFIHENYETFKHSLESGVYEKFKSMKKIPNMDDECKQVIEDMTSCPNPIDSYWQFQKCTTLIFL